MSGRAQVGQEPEGPAPLPSHLTLTRDKHGRFRPKDAPLPGADPTADFLEASGITPRMQAAALADYVPPDDPHDKDQLERRLREYIVANLGTWVNGRHCNLQMVFAALKDTYAIDQMYYATLLAEARAARALAALGGAGGPARESMAGTAARPTGTRVRPGQRVLTYRIPVNVGEGPVATAVSGGGPCASAAQRNLSPSRCAEQSNGVAYHRDTATQRKAGDLSSLPTAPLDGNNLSQAAAQLTRHIIGPAACGQDSDLTNSTPDFSVSRCLGGETTADTPTTAGGRKALPYDPGDDSETLRLGDLAVETLVVNVYDPDYDVVGNLSQKVKNALCPEGSYQGFGNDPQQAVESYYAKNKAEMRSYGGDWEMFGMGCKVYEQFDKQQRRYYVARLDGSVDRKAQEATLFGTVDDSTVGVAPARPAFDLLDIEEGRTGATHTVIGAGSITTSRAATTLKPSPFTLEPSRPPPHYLHLHDAP